MNRFFRLALLAAWLPFAPASGQDTPPADDAIVYRAFLLGDAGGLDPEEPNPVLETLRSRLGEADKNAVLVFLGDNIYCCGLPDSSHPGRALAEARLRQQLAVADDFEGRVVVIPGNHDWDNSGDDGLAAVRRQEVFVEDFLDRGNTFLPDDGFPGPEVVDLTDDLTMVVLDTEWWLRDGEKGFGDAGRYDIEEDGDVLLHFADVLRRRDNANLLVVAHHPLKSNGTHGGNFPIREHIFPLTAKWKNAFIPLPIIGSLYPLIRSWVGGPQDLSHWKYRSLRTALEDLLVLHPKNVVFASGHEHSLQHFPEGNLHQVISGSASRPEYVATGRGAAFTSSEPGFMEVRYYNDGSIWLLAWTAEGIQYQNHMYTVPDAVPLTLGREDAPATTQDETYTGAAGPELAAGGFWRTFMGSHYRDAWTTEVTVPVFDIGTAKGGLTPVKRGGGLQTVSLRLENEQGRQFVLRTLAKNPVQSLPDELKKTLASNVLVDQVAIQHPYAALLVPTLANALGIYHTNPEIVFIPRDPRFGRYVDDVGGRLALFEERPDDDMSDSPTFGFSDEVIGAPDMFKEITKDNDHRVDQRMFARGRLFDILLSDWDRHMDQFRWAVFEPEDGKGKIYRPIPRDRDFAFNKLDGLFPRIMQSRYVIPKFQSFKPKYGIVRGLVENGLIQDRRLTAAMTPQDWKEIADSMKVQLTDVVISSAFDQWPPEIQERYRSELDETLRSRRDDLTSAAETYSRILDRYVDIVGSNKHEEFVISRPAANQTQVVVYKTSKKGKRDKELYRRTFDSGRSKELRLYGFGGQDRFYVDGVGRGLDVYVIGGTGDDTFEDRSSGPGRHGRVYVMDVEGGITASPGRATRMRLSDDSRVNRYDPLDYAIVKSVPRVFMGANEDDGVFLGGGATFFTHRFRRHPFAASHTLVANYAMRTDAYNVLYGSEFTHLLGNWDVLLDAGLRSPNNIYNFFGLGNESLNTDETEEFYEAQLSRLSLQVGLRRQMALGSTVTFSPFMSRTRVRQDENGFVGIPQPGISASTFEDQLFAGFTTSLDFDLRDSKVMPRHGFHWESSLAVNLGLNDASLDYTRLMSTFSFYVTRSVESRTTLAFRVGTEHRIGDFPFFDASSLGGIRNLRGWTSTRFAGRTSFYGNAEFRTRVGHFTSIVGNGSYGVLGFMDNGRVWTDGESSRDWHQGYGFGAWMTMFDAFVVSGSVGYSSEQDYFQLGAGFTF
ncbi:MAG: hypothetical protein ACI84D_000156 [Thalassolituus oleivorans]|jgi:hypothetical protein